MRVQSVYNVIVPWIFEKLFRTYVFPFERSDDLIRSMPVAERTEYFRQAKDLLDNRVFNQELKELIRTYYQEMACKTTNAEELNYYRLTIKALSDLEKRVRGLAIQYVPPGITNIEQNL